MKDRIDKIESEVQQMNLEFSIAQEESKAGFSELNKTLKGLLVRLSNNNAEGGTINDLLQLWTDRSLGKAMPLCSKIKP